MLFAPACLLLLLNQAYASMFDRNALISAVQDSCRDVNSLPRLEGMLCTLEANDELDSEFLQAAVMVSPAPCFGVVADMLVACGAKIDSITLNLASDRFDAVALNILLGAISFDDGYERILESLFKRLMSLATNETADSVSSIIRVLQGKGLVLEDNLIESCIERGLLGLVPALSSLRLPVTSRALRIAIRNDDLEAAELVLRLGVSPNASINRSSALNYAIKQSSSLPLIALLLMAGANGSGADIVDAYSIGRVDIAELLIARGVRLELMERFQIMLMGSEQPILIDV
jgi:hypothetical protein